MRLLYVIHQFFPDCRSGTEQYCLAVAREARRRGDEVTVLSLNWDHDRDWPAIRLFELPYDGFRVLRLDHWRRINANDVLRDYENLHLEGWFRKVLDDVQPQAVHFFHLRQLGSNLIRVAGSLGIRTVVNLMDFWFLCPRFTLLRGDGSLCEGPPAGGAGCVTCNHPELQDAVPAPDAAALTSDPPARLRALLDRPTAQMRALAAADAVIAPSQFLADLFKRNGFGGDRITVLPYGLAAGRYHPTPVTRPRNPMRFAFCGVLSPWKAPMLAIEAVRASSAPLSLSVWGNASEPMFADYITKLRGAAGDDPRIHFAGAYGESDAAGVFADMDALVVPSTWYENTPFVVLEAFAAGVPVIASDLGGLREIVHHEHDGLLFRAGDATALRDSMQRLIDDQKLYGRLRPPIPPTVASNYDTLAAIYAQPPLSR